MILDSVFIKYFLYFIESDFCRKMFLFGAFVDFVKRRYEYLVLVFVLVLGSFLRIVYLGEGSLWIDESISALSAKAILEHGYPLLDSGAVYSRAELFHYLMAFFVWVFRGDFGVRFVSVLFGVFTIFLAYLYSKKFTSSNVLRLIFPFLVSISCVEIIYSRQARFYQAFQFFYFLSVYLFLGLSLDLKKENFLVYIKRKGFCIGFYVVLYLNLIDTSIYSNNFSDSIKGYIAGFESDFGHILFNNLRVNLLTLIVSLFVFSGMILILIWNASVVSFYLYSLGSHKQALFTSFLLLSHGLLEVAGYILSGIAGAILAYRMDLAYSNRFYKEYDSKTQTFVKKEDRRGTFKKLLNKRLFLDLFYLLFVSNLFVFLGAVIEVM